MREKIKYTHIPKLEEKSFNFDHVKINLHEQITLHQQKTWELSYIIIGSGTRIMGDQIESFSRNEIILIPPDLPHCWSFDKLDIDKNGKIENITITLSNNFLERCMSSFPELATYIGKILQRKSAVSFKGKTLKQLQQLMTAMVYETEIERLSSLIKILAIISTPEDIHAVGNPTFEDKKSKRMQKLLLYIMNNYQHSITLNDVSKLIGLDKSSFCIFLKKMTNKTFFTYLTEYRIEVSCLMIAKTNMTISEICYSSGFKDVPYYNRVFKKLKSMTPSEYRSLTKQKACL